MHRDNALADHEDRDRLIHILRTSLAVTTSSQFFGWTQGPVQALLPHEILICGHAGGNRGEIILRYFTATRYFKQQHFDAACHPRYGLVTKAIRKWRNEPRPCLVPPPAGAPACESEWPEILARLELKNLACHGMYTATGGMQAWFGLGRVPRLDERIAYLLELLTPCLATTYARVVSAESEPVAGDLTVRNLLTPREIEVLERVRDGLSNPEIAAVLGLSAMTAKNHVQNILAKLKVRTRGQAVVEAIRQGLIRSVREDA